MSVSSKKPEIINKKELNLRIGYLIFMEFYVIFEVIIYSFIPFGHELKVLFQSMKRNEPKNPDKYRDEKLSQPTPIISNLRFVR